MEPTPDDINAIVDRVLAGNGLPAAMTFPGRAPGAAEMAIVLARLLGEPDRPDAVFRATLKARVLAEADKSQGRAPGPSGAQPGSR